MKAKRPGAGARRRGGTARNQAPWPRLLTVGLVALLTVSTVAVAPTTATATATGQPRALILGPTVNAQSGDGSRSLEELEAQAAGFDVVVLPNWDALTAADFAQFQVLIIGDPKSPSSDTPTTPATYVDALTTERVWGPVVMGSGGSKIVIGTDPSHHH